MKASNGLVDLDDQRTWPTAVVERVGHLEKQLRESTEFTVDLPFSQNAEEEILSALAGCGLLAFHATRLLEHEVLEIRSVGLRRLTRDLVEDRISSAHARGLLSEGERDRCRTRNIFAIDNVVGREDQVCLVFGRRIFDEVAHGLSPFLGGWGGEAMNGWPRPDEDPVLQRLGKPSLVVATVDLGAGERRPFMAPSLAKVFLGARLGLSDAGGEVHTFADIPAEDIIDIWQPGNSEYDRHRELPQL
jgi:hypothetical protein